MLDFNFPAHWQTIKLKYAFDEVSKKNFPDETLLVASQSMGVVPKEIYGQRTVEATKDLHLLKLVEVGNFVISLRSFQGGIEYAYYRGIISPAYTVLKSNGTYYEHYFRYLAKSAPFIDVLKTCVTGIREGQNIDYKILKNKLIPLPPRDEQEKIVRYLDKKTAQAQKIIDAKTQQVEFLQELKRATISKAVTTGIFSAVTPDTWQTFTLRKFLKPVSKKNFPDMPLLSVTRDNGIIIRNVESKEINHNFIPQDLSNYKLVRKGQFVINKMKAWQGSCGVSDYDGIVSPAYYVFELDYPYKKFFHYAIRSQNYIDIFAKLSTGIRVDQWDLPLQKIKQIPFPLPPLWEQKEIADYLDAKCGKIESLIEALQKEVELVRELQKSLIAEAVTGKIDLQKMEV